MIGIILSYKARLLTTHQHEESLLSKWLLTGDSFSSSYNVVNFGLIMPVLGLPRR